MKILFNQNKVQKEKRKKKNIIIKKQACLLQVNYIRQRKKRFKIKKVLKFFLIII